jgi:hypothetical protein
MKALFALVLLFDLVVLSGTFDLGALFGASHALVAKPIGNDRTTHVHSLVAANDILSEPLDFSRRNHFGL